LRNGQSKNLIFLSGKLYVIEYTLFPVMFMQELTVKSQRESKKPIPKIHFDGNGNKSTHIIEGTPKEATNSCLIVDDPDAQVVRLIIGLYGICPAQQVNEEKFGSWKRRNERARSWVYGSLSHQRGTHRYFFKFML